jgi:hypothetical protein
VTKELVNKMQYREQIGFRFTDSGNALSRLISRLLIDDSPKTPLTDFPIRTRVSNSPSLSTTASHPVEQKNFAASWAYIWGFEDHRYLSLDVCSTIQSSFGRALLYESTVLMHCCYLS